MVGTRGGVREQRPMYAGLEIESDDADSGTEEQRDEVVSDFPDIRAELSRPFDSTEWQTKFRVRGLLNQRNNCFLNACLQALLACNNFRAFLRRLSQVIPYLDVVTTPVCLALHLLFQEWGSKDTGLYDAEFPGLSQKQTGRRRSGKKKAETAQPSLPLSAGVVQSPIYPTSFEETINRFSQNCLGRHEDAHEFLSFLIDEAHEELVKLGSEMRSGPDSLAETISELGFTAVVSSKRGRRPVVVDMQDSLISRVFGGKLRVSLSKQRETHQVVPFFSLALPIDAHRISTVNEALAAFSARSYIRGVRQGDREVNAFQISRIQHLPPVLALQLKRFAYDAGSAIKIDRHIGFEETLQLPDVCLVPALQSAPRTYHLRCIVVHVGKEHSHGHYTASVRDDKGGWLSIDDDRISQTDWKTVRKQQAYMLLYELKC
ncbi:ubiquitinyl hydrolase 1 [Plasmodiophora brassicae]|uniref:ubiquitinyl hydrolase 1 n=1 Tax=Plasmodiophora brassicae TaxID=37360 RepID=A0A0G4ILL6_PLABS|nr:hypothetical protein PBRA_004806 [Plasmodiophora brassicae]